MYGNEAPSMHGMKHNAPGMYGKGSKISYGNYSGMKMSGYPKAGLAGQGLKMNSQQKISRHMSSGMYKKGK